MIESNAPFCQEEQRITQMGFLFWSALPMKILLRIMHICFFVSLLNSIGLAQVGIITTYAGPPLPVNGARATDQAIGSPSSIAIDRAGGFYISGADLNRVYRVSADGKITLVAGNGSYGFAGDGGPATSAQLYNATGVAVDSVGNLFIADTANNRIRKVDTSGIIITVAGNGFNGMSGDGGLATLAELNYPRGVAVDSVGNLFIADGDNSRIRKVDTSGIITTVAGDGYMHPNGDIGDSGPATLAQLNYPTGVAVDSIGNIFIADTNNNRIRKVDTSGIITTVAGSGPSAYIGGYSGDGGSATLAQLSSPTGVAVDSTSNLLIADRGSHRICKISNIGNIAAIAGNGYEGFGGDGGPATSAQLDQPTGVAVDSKGNIYIADTNNNRIRKVSKPNTSIDLILNAGSIEETSTVSGNPDVQAGYATVTLTSGAVPYGTAVFSFKEGGVTVSEAGIPASPPTVAARIFIDYRSSVNAVPARDYAGMVDINTGIAAANNGITASNVTYTLRDASGGIIATGHGTIGAGKHFSCFIDQLKDIASDFNLPADFQTAIQFGALDITSDQPLSVLALRGTYNQRRQFIITTTPIADLTRSLDNGPLYFAQVADGGGYTTSLILMNTSAANETGTLQIMDNNGAAIIVNPVGGTSGSSFNYSIPPNGVYRLQTDGSPADWRVGWVKLAPSAGTSTPVGSGIFGFNPVDVLVTESGVPGASATTHARIYVDRSERHNTGLAIANLNDTPATVMIDAYESDGVTVAGTSDGPLTLAAHGHDAKFADQLITGLPAEFTGILDISSTMPFAALTVRSLYNENGDYLMTAFPVADVNQAASSPIVFPQIADGGGYTTQFILLSADEAASVTIHYYDNDGAPLAIGR
jgi:sugar lactone lactonase YvrE